MAAGDLIDIGNLRDMERKARSGTVVEVTADFLAQLVTELSAGREAEAQRGRCFGLPEGKTL
ncbi:hypothetical protein AEB_P2039 [Altererythrobacter sp. B11]|nr:hypothetical protein AEB_P2039 [Altererythrobacter sp. B11]